MPKSLEFTTTIQPNNNKLTNNNDENHTDINNDNVVVVGGGGGGVADADADAEQQNSSSLTKKYRHQNYSKNIYIGTRNAERWELTRVKLAFKNDVEFVSHLLILAEKDFENFNGYVHFIFIIKFILNSVNYNIYII